MDSDEIKKKCGHCKVNLRLSFYDTKRSGDLKKTCRDCCTYSKNLMRQRKENNKINK